MTNPSLAFEIRQVFLQAVSWTVMSQLYLIVVVSVLTFFLLLLRRWNLRRFQRLDAYYGEIIMNELLETDVDHVPLVKTHQPKPHEWLKRRALKQILLNNIRSISGQEKIMLVRAYCQLGFANLDRDLCYSTFWWRRLEGVSGLSGLDLQDSAIVFDELRGDRHDLVAMAATLALSGIRHERNEPGILNGLSPKAVRRRNLLLQIANNWTRVYGADFVLRCLRTERRDDMIKVFVAALAELNSPEVGAELTNWIRGDGSNKREPQTLVYIIRTLKTIGDPSSLSAADSFLLHADEHVRAEALDLILRLSDPADYQPYLSVLKYDTSLSVQRVLRRVTEKGMAA